MRGTQSPNKDVGGINMHEAPHVVGNGQLGRKNQVRVKMVSGSVVSKRERASTEGAVGTSPTNGSPMALVSPKAPGGGRKPNLMTTSSAVSSGPSSAKKKTMKEALVSSSRDTASTPDFTPTSSSLNTRFNNLSVQSESEARLSAMAAECISDSGISSLTGSPVAVNSNHSSRVKVTSLGLSVGDSSPKSKDVNSKTGKSTSTPVSGPIGGTAPLGELGTGPFGAGYVSNQTGIVGGQRPQSWSWSFSGELDTSAPIPAPPAIVQSPLSSPLSSPLNSAGHGSLNLARMGTYADAKSKGGDLGMENTASVRKGSIGENSSVAPSDLIGRPIPSLREPMEEARNTDTKKAKSATTSTIGEIKITRAHSLNNVDDLEKAVLNQAQGNGLGSGNIMKFVNSVNILDLVTEQQQQSQPNSPSNK